jgi:hypothetical protein
MAYISVKPLAEKAQYDPNDTIDFLLDFGMGNELVGNSIRFESQLVVLNADATLVNEAIFYDSNAGAHSFFQQIVTMMSDKTIENINYYPRYASMKSQTGEVPINKMAISTNASELKTLDDNQTAYIMMINQDNYDEGIYRSFSIKPYFCLNNSSGNVAYAKSGQIKVSITLASLTQALFGTDLTLAGTSYYLTDLRLSARVVPQSPASAKVVMGVVSCVRQNITSNNTSLSVIVPIATTSFSATFRNQAAETSPVLNYIQLDALPSCSRVELSFSDSLSNLIEFPLETREEIILNYLASMGYTGKQAIITSDGVVGVGLAYNELLQNTKLGINLISEASNTANGAYAMYIFFKGVVGM